MKRRMAQCLAVFLLIGFCTASGANDADAETAARGDTPSARFLLGPPEGVGPVIVDAAFTLQDINEISDAAETFEFTGVLILRWKDARQSFDPSIAGVEEKIFQGAFQFDEVAPGWYPQIVLVNESGLYQTSGVTLRLRPDGSATLIQTINAAAEVDFDMQRFPFDAQSLEAVFAVLGFDRNEVRLEVEPGSGELDGSEIRVPQWSIGRIELESQDRAAPYAGRDGVASSLVLRVDAQRNSLYMRRLIIAPLILIVLLSFSVFWMDRSSIGDRLSVSFIGILSAVAYQIVTSDQLPHIAKVTVMHGFLNLSFLIMCLTVVVTLRVSILDRRGEVARGDALDRRSRWAFPLGYFTLVLALLAIELLLR